MKVCFEDIGHMSATFAAESGESGKVCKVCGNGAVAVCSEGECFCGVMESVRKGFAGVQLHGFVTLPYSGTAPGLGYQGLVADADGGIMLGEGREYLVVSVDEGTMHAVIEL